MTFPGKVAAALGLAAIAALAWIVRDVLLLVFGGLLLAVVLSSLASAVVRWSGMGWRAAVASSVVLILLAAAALFAWVGAELAQQAADLGDQLPRAVEAVRHWLSDVPLGSRLLEQWHRLRSQELPLGRVASGAALGAGMLGNLLLALLLAVFIAGEPGLYRTGAVRLLPLRHRAAVGQALDACGTALRGWLKGQGLSMLFVGVATGAGLWLLDVPLALLLGVLAGILDFVPFIGPIVSGLIAVLLAFAQGPQTALYVALLALAIQQVEGNIMIPLLQKWAVRLPPALALVGVVIAASLFGWPGILLATPLMVIAMVLVRELYVERALEQRALAARDER